MKPNDTDQSIPVASPKRGTIRGRLKDAKLSAVGAELDKGDSWGKDVLNGKQGVMLDEIEPLLITLGLKVVDAKKVCVDRATAQAYETIARRAMAKESTLIWDDAE